jgi:hypothetical protein
MEEQTMAESKSTRNRTTRRKAGGDAERPENGDTPVRPVIFGAVRQVVEDHLEPLPGIPVQLTNGGRNLVDIQVTGEDGGYVFTNLSTGTFHLSFPDAQFDPDTLLLLEAMNEPPDEIEVTEDDADVLVPDIVYRQGAAGQAIRYIDQKLDAIADAVASEPTDLAPVEQAINSFSVVLGTHLAQIQELLELRVPVPEGPGPVAEVQVEIDQHRQGWDAIVAILRDPVDIRRAVIEQIPALADVDGQLDYVQAIAAQESRWLAVQRQLLNGANARAIRAEMVEHRERNRDVILRSLDGLINAAQIRGAGHVPDSDVTWPQIAAALQGLRDEIANVQFDGGGVPAVLGPGGAAPAPVAP